MNHIEEPTKVYQAFARSVELAKHSRAEDERNHPSVGVVLVKNGEIVGEAFRGEFTPGEHAEYTLFERHLPEIDLRGAILITTLEPCTSRNSHKPCADWIIEREIARVVIGMLDPNPQIYGQGVVKLRENGIEIDYFPKELRENIRLENAIFIDQFHANPALAGESRFNFTHNDGRFSIGNGPLIFQTRWSNASNTSIHCYKDRTNLRGVGLAIHAASIEEVRDASVYDMSSRVCTPREGEFVVVRNNEGNYAAIEIVDVRARSHGDDYDSLTIRYRINDDGSSEFR